MPLRDLLKARKSFPFLFSSSTTVYGRAGLADYGYAITFRCAYKTMLLMAQASNLLCSRYRAGLGRS